jgi:hypothetical protein
MILDNEKIAQHCLLRFTIQETEMKTGYDFKTPITNAIAGFAVAAAFFSSVAMAQVTPFSVNANADEFTGWTQVFEGDGTVRGDFIGASGTGMDVNNRSWGLFANASSGDPSGVSRIYAFDGVLAENQYVEISVSLGFINDFSVVGFSLRNSAGTNRFEAYYQGPRPTGEPPVNDVADLWKINDAGGQRDIEGPSTTFAETSWANNNFVTFRFTQLANDTYSLSVNGSDITNSDLNLSASDIDRIRIFNWNAGEGTNHNQYFNNLVVIPEPGTLALTLVALSSLVFLRKRKK